MKRVLVLSFCLVAFELMAQVIYQPHRRKDFRISAPACSTYNTTNAWDNFIEGFQTPTTGYESNVWTGVGTTANITVPADSSSLTTYKPDGACNQAFKLVVPTDGTETYIRGDLGASIDLDTIQTDVYFSLYVETGPDNSESYFIFGYRQSTTPSPSASIALGKTAGGQLQLTCGSSVNISAGQWYVIKWSFDIAQAVGGSSMTIWSNGSEIGSVTFQRAATTDMRYIFSGAIAGLDVNDSGTIWFDLIAIKTN